MAEVIIRRKAKIRLAKILEAAYTEYGKTTLNLQLVATGWVICDKKTT